MYLIFPFTAAVVSLCILLEQEFSVKRVTVAILALVFAGCMIQSVVKVYRTNLAKGTGIFTSAIFDLVDYTADNEMDDDLLFVEWGFYAQYYFMNKGEFTIRQVVWDLRSDITQEEAVELSEECLSWMLEDRQTCYFPCYLDKSGEIQNGQIALFVEGAVQNGFDVTIERDFYEADGTTPIIRLYKVS